jgi:hypothetical protein
MSEASANEDRRLMRNPSMRVEQDSPTPPAEGARLRLVSDRVRSFEWESFDRRTPRARDRLGPLAPCKAKRPLRLS